MPRTFREMVAEAKSEIREITPEELKRRQRIGERIVLVDVREADSYAESHVTGARSIPRGMLEMEIDEVAPEGDETIVCYCGGGSRSALATQTLRQMGYANPLSLAGGFRRWNEEGGATES